MDLQRTAKEIGLFETAANMAKVMSSADVVQKVGAAMPLPDDDVSARAKLAAEWLYGKGKTKYFFLSPEIAVIHELELIADKGTEVIVAVPFDIDNDAKERMINNVPQGIKVTMLEEPNFPPPRSFFPSNGIIVIFGYLGGDRAMVLPETYRMVEHYSGFRGKKVFIPYKELNAAERYDSWRELNEQRITEKWRKQ